MWQFCDQGEEETDIWKREYVQRPHRVASLATSV